MFIGLLSICAIGSFGSSLASNYRKPIKYVSINNRPCQARPTLVNINSDETLFYQFTVYVEGVVTLLMIHILEFLFKIK